MPSSSARCSQLPRAVDKLPFYVALCKLRNHLRGDLPNLDDSEVTFPDLELKVEPKKERLDGKVKQETSDPETNTALVSNQLTSSAAFPLTVEIKTEGSSFMAKQKKGRRKRSAAAESGGKEIPSAISSLSGTVSSPYCFPMQQPYHVYATDSVKTGHYTIAEAVDTTNQVKRETPFDFAQYGHMPADLSIVKTYSCVLPLPDVKPRFCWRPTNL